MKVTGKVLLTVALVCAMTAFGCTKKVELTFVNHTPQVLAVKVTTPDDGTMNIGSIGADGSKLKAFIKLNTGDLPAQCTAAVGANTKHFTVSEATKGKLWFHNTDKGLAGPTDKDTPVTVIQQTGEIKMSTEPQTVVE